MLASLAPAPHLAVRGRTAVVRWLYVAAALAIVWMSVGMPRPFENPPSTDGITPGAATGSSGARSADIVLPVPVESLATVVPARPVAPARSSAPVPRSTSTPGPAATHAAAPAPSSAPGAPGMLDSRPLAAGTAAALSLTSLRVIHQHRLGSCRGQLVVSRDGVAYVPEDDGPGKDGFRLKYTQFLEELNGASLRISSNNRDYRFKVAASSGNDHEQLERLATAIAKFR
jgi:hypothetical protein